MPRRTISDSTWHSTQNTAVSILRRWRTTLLQFTLFNNWGQNAITYTYWYMSPDMNKVYTKTE
jgi:hypothetical protein